MPRILFYPRPPRGGRPARLYSSATLGRFLPTPSARRATDLNKAELADLLISTHALREEGDPPEWAEQTSFDQFLPTPSARRATISARKAAGKRCISTHALREEGDLAGKHTVLHPPVISTHALREEGDQQPRDTSTKTAVFLPTPSARRATKTRGGCPHAPRISTHALREEGDTKISKVMRVKLISTHALREEGDCLARSSKTAYCRKISTHALREEGDVSGKNFWRRGSHFYPRPPRGGRRYAAF